MGGGTGLTLGSEGSAALVGSGELVLQGALISTAGALTMKEGYDRASQVMEMRGSGEGKSTIQENARQGKEFEKKVVEKKKETSSDVQEQVTVKTKSGVKTRLDALGTADATGQVEMTEAKSSPTAKLTPNQKAAFPEIEESGATVVGNGKPGFPGGTKLPPTKVDVVRPPEPGQ